MPRKKVSKQANANTNPVAVTDDMIAPGILADLIGAGTGGELVLA